MASAQDQWLVALGVPAEIFLLVGGEGANGGGAQPDEQKSGPDTTPPTSTGSGRGPGDANQAKLKTNLPRTQERPGTGNPNAVQAANAEDSKAQRPTYSEDREQALRQGMVARANESAAQPAPAPAVDYTKGLVPPPSYLAKDAPEMLEVWEKIKKGDTQARETWISVMGTPESQGKNKAALAQAKADVQKAKQQAATDSKIGAALSAVNPVAGKIYEKIGGLETLKELGKTDWKKEWNDTALAIGDQVQKRVDSLAEEIVALPDHVHDAVKKLEKSVDAVAEELVALPGQVDHALDTLKKATSGWDLDQVKGTLGTLAGQAYDDAKKALDEGKKQLAEAKKRLAEAEEKIAKEVGNAVSDPQAAVKQLMQAATDKYNDVERKLQKAEKDFWRANPEKMREKLADLTVEAASQAAQAVALEGGTKILGKGLNMVRGAEKVEEGAKALEEGAEALKGGRQAETLGKAGQELEEAGAKGPHGPGGTQKLPPGEPGNVVPERTGPGGTQKLPSGPPKNVVPEGTGPHGTQKLPPGEPKYAVPEGKGPHGTQKLPPGEPKYAVPEGKGPHGTQKLPPGEPKYAVPEGKGPHGTQKLPPGEPKYTVPEGKGPHGTQKLSPEELKNVVERDLPEEGPAKRPERKAPNASQSEREKTPVQNKNDPAFKDELNRQADAKARREAADKVAKAHGYENAADMQARQERMKDLEKQWDEDARKHRVDRAREQTGETRTEAMDRLTHERSLVGTPYDPNPAEINIRTAQQQLEKLENGEWKSLGMKGPPDVQHVNRIVNQYEEAVHTMQQGKDLSTDFWSRMPREQSEFLRQHVEHFDPKMRQQWLDRILRRKP